MKRSENKVKIDAFRKPSTCIPIVVRIEYNLKKNQFITHVESTQLTFFTRQLQSSSYAVHCGRNYLSVTNDIVVHCDKNYFFNNK